MTEGEKWRPKSHPSPLEHARQFMTDPRTGEMRFRNRSNMFWGYVLAWGLFTFSALWLNQSILTDSDPMTGREVLGYAATMFIASLASACVLGRPYLTLRDGLVTVRNPLRIYTLRLIDVESVVSGFLGFPKLSAAGRTIRVMGMEESGLDQLGGGSDDMAVLQMELEARVPENDQEQAAGVVARWALMDLGLALLLTAWAVYAVSFYWP